MRAVVGVPLPALLAAGEAAANRDESEVRAVTRVRGGRAPAVFGLGSFGEAFDAAAETLGAPYALRRQRLAFAQVLLAALASAADAADAVDGPVPVDELHEHLGELALVLVGPQEHSVWEPVEDAPAERLDVTDVAQRLDAGQAPIVQLVSRARIASSNIGRATSATVSPARWMTRPGRRA